jgi:hypothetical protein
VTAVVQLERGEATLRFYDTLKSNRIRFHGQSTQLAANFTAALAIQERKAVQKLPELLAVLRAEPYLAFTGLYRTEPNDPGKIPVVMMHGINSRPDTWNDVFNELRADRVIRENFQFFEFYYPTGIPIINSGSRLREELSRLEMSMASDPF